MLVYSMEQKPKSDKELAKGMRSVADDAWSRWEKDPTIQRARAARFFSILAANTEAVASSSKR